MAQALYDDLDFGSLPILADMLEEVGCTDADLLMHLRGRERCLTCAGRGFVQFDSPDGGNLRVFCKHTERTVHPAIVPDRSKAWAQVCLDRFGPWRCDGTGWIVLRGRHVRGCWALDLLLGKE